MVEFDSKKTWFKRSFSLDSGGRTTYNRGMDRPSDRAPKGYVIHESPDSPVIAVAILNSENKKTGNMIQVYILDRSQHPVEAVRNGTDDVICGDCPLRSGNGCYVTVWQGPLSVWKQYRAREE